MNFILHLIFHVILRGATHPATRPTIEADEAEPFLVWRCPQCRQVKEFQIIEECFDLKCTGCGYKLEVPTSDEAFLEQSLAATRQLRDGSLPAAEYKQRIEAIPARFVENLKALTEVWLCPQCNEENPLNFAECWNCHSRDRKPTTAIDESTPPYPGRKPGGNPWEM